MVEITICPFCLTIFLYENCSGDECSECHVGIVENIDEYNARIKELKEHDE